MDSHHKALIYHLLSPALQEKAFCVPIIYIGVSEGRGWGRNFIICVNFCYTFEDAESCQVGEVVNIASPAHSGFKLCELLYFEETRVVSGW